MNPLNSPFHAGLVADTATADITRLQSVFVFGYPHVQRTRTGIHGWLEQTTRGRTPVKIQAIMVGGWTLTGWPGEFFVEYALTPRARTPGAFLVTLANGKLQGCIVTPTAAANHLYQAGKAVFARSNGGAFSGCDTCAA